MRIAYVSLDPRMRPFGWGAGAVHVQEVIRALIQLGHQVTLFTPAGDGIVPSDLKALRVRRLPPLPPVTGPARERAALRLNDVLRKALETESDFSLASPQPTPRFDLVYERHSIWGFSAMSWARRHGIPGVLEVNAPLLPGQPIEELVHQADLAWAVALRSLSAASVLIAVSEGVAECLSQIPVAAGKIEIVPNGVNLERFVARSRLPMAEGEPEAGFTIGFAGSFSPHHGLDQLLLAFAMVHARHKDARLLIIGDGPERSRLEGQASARGLHGAVRWVGAVDPEEMPGWLSTLDVAVAPYPRLNGFYYSPLNVLEYLAAGLPVVASRIGSLPRFIEHGVNGWLVPPGDPAALAAALDFLRRNITLRDRLGAAAQAAAFAHHSWRQAVQQILAAAARVPPSPPAGQTHGDTTTFLWRRESVPHFA